MQEILSLHALKAAPLILGSILMYDSPEGRVSGVITEVEVYAHDDPASHSFKGQTERNIALFGPPGTIYIYFIYGMHYCLNIVTGEGSALLIRALEPLEGIDIMKKHRRTDNIKNLCNGPAKLVEALGVPPDFNGKNFFFGSLRLESGKKVPARRIIATPRIGITKAIDKPWRFYVTSEH